MHGIEIFRNYFREFKDQYVLIGGSACALWFSQAGIDFRATKDLDVVLIVEALTPHFGEQFWKFIQEGGYENRRRATKQAQYYRFEKPQNTAYPAMIEIFSRTDKFPYIPDSRIVSIHIDDGIASLSAILLDEDYYNILMKGRDTVSDMVVLKTEYLILFKIKAFLDMKVNSGHEAQKHLRDIVRLTTLLTGNEEIDLPEKVKGDMNQFVEIYIQEPYDPKQLEIPMSTEEFRLLLVKVFG